MSEDSLC